MAAVTPLLQEGIWFDKWRVDDAERTSVIRRTMQTSVDKPSESCTKAAPQKTQSQVLSELQKTKAHVRSSLEQFTPQEGDSNIEKIVTNLVEENKKLHGIVGSLQKEVSSLKDRMAAIERGRGGATDDEKAMAAAPKENGAPDDDDDDVDLFGSSDEDEEAARLKEERISAYQKKKTAKPAAVAKSSVVLDVKPWDDETDMADVERCVRSIEMDGLIWGKSQLVPVGYGIKKLQIGSVIVDELVSVEELEEKICAFEDFVQSVDVAAFNKI